MTAPQSAAEFWSLAAQSQLLSAQECLQLGAEFAATGGSTAQAAADWLVGRDLLSAFQAKALLAGQAGPFHYGDYVVYDRIEAGRFAGRFRAAHKTTRHPVLLEFLTAEQGADPAFLELLRSRAEIAKAIRSPHVQRLYAFVEAGAYKFLVMEDLAGASLVEMLRGKRNCTPSEAVRFTRWAALGLKAWREAGIAHHAIASRNLWLEPVGNVKLLCSISTLMGATKYSASDAILLDYRAPETSSADAEPTEQSDIYSLGVLLYELIIGRAPFASVPHDQKAQAHRTESIPSLSASPQLAPLNKVIAKAMAKNPAERFASAEEFAATLGKMLKPDRLAPGVTTPPETLAAFEQALAAAAPQKAAAASTAAPVAIPVTQPAASARPVIAIPTTPVAAKAAPEAPKIAIPTPAPVAAPAVAPLIKTEPQSVASRVAKRRSSSGPGPVVWGGAAVLLLALIGGVGAYALGLFGSSSETPKPSDGGDSGGTTAVAANETSTDSDQTPIVPDNGELLWAAPTSGEPIDLANVPPGAQVFVHLRPAAILENAEGRRVLQSLGPAFETWRTQWSQQAGAAWEEIDSLLIAFIDVENQAPRPYYIVTLKQAKPAEELAAKWSGAEKKSAGGAEYYVAGELAYWLPSAEAGQFVMGAEPDVVEAAGAPGLPPPLRREIEQLRKSSDRERSVSVLFPPGYLFTDGRDLLSGPLARLRQPLQTFLGDGLQGGLVSAHLGQDAYLELRLVGVSDKPKTLVAAEVRSRLEQLPSEIESYIDRIAENPHWSRLRRQFPSMVRFLHANTRVGAEENQAIVNCYLPLTAAHNLTAAAELTLASEPGAAVVVAASNPSTGPKTIEEVLNYRFTLEIPQQDLINALADLEKSVVDAHPNLPFVFKIAFGDGLQAEGITRNQPIRQFKMENATVAEILTGLMMKANPVTTVKSPSEKDQKLVWAIGPDPADPSRRIVLITTRAAAEKASLPLPAVFQPPM